MFSIEKLRCGIEHEFPVIRADGEFGDFTNTTFDELQPIIDALPYIASDYPDLRIGAMQIKLKRWYVEGYKRLNADGEYRCVVPKGCEIRTPICGSIDEAITTLSQDFHAWQQVAKSYGFSSAAVAHNPFRTSFVPDPPLNTWERKRHTRADSHTLLMHMLTYGPDISFSHPDFSTEESIRIGKKLTYYSPYIVPFSFSSPFYNGTLWSGLSYRTYFRTGPRPAVLVHLKNKSDLLKTNPTLTDHARIPAEAGRIEFKAFDMIADMSLYRALGALLIGLMRDTTLSGEATVPDREMHQRSAQEGFAHPDIYAGALAVLEAAHNALPKTYQVYLEPLFVSLKQNQVPAHTQIEMYQRSGSITEAIAMKSKEE